jgi:hypothetical protein
MAQVNRRNGAEIKKERIPSVTEKNFPLAEYKSSRNQCLHQWFETARPKQNHGHKDYHKNNNYRKNIYNFYGLETPEILLGLLVANLGSL